MAKNQTDFGISFRALLNDATEALGWPQPMYYHYRASFERNEANLVLARGKGPNACLFRGDSCCTLVESKEHAAEQAVDFLVQKKQIVVEDANLSRKEMYKACCHFYKEKRKALENVGQALLGCERSAPKTLKVVVPSSLPKKVTADLWSIWLQVVAAYDVDVDEVDFITQPGGRHVCCFTIRWSKPSSRERYFIGDSSDTLEKAKAKLGCESYKLSSDYFRVFCKRCELQ